MLGSAWLLAATAALVLEGESGAEGGSLFHTQNKSGDGTRDWLLQTASWTVQPPKGSGVAWIEGRLDELTSLWHRVHTNNTLSEANAEASSHNEGKLGLLYICGSHAWTPQF